MSGPEQSVTNVTIFNQNYQLRGSGDPDYVRELARFVDNRMSELARSTPTVDSLRIAVLAALNIANDYLIAKQQKDGLEKTVHQRVDRMLTMLEPYREERES